MAIRGMPRKRVFAISCFLEGQRKTIVFKMNNSV